MARQSLLADSEDKMPRPRTAPLMEACFCTYSMTIVALQIALIHRRLVAIRRHGPTQAQPVSIDSHDQVTSRPEISIRWNSRSQSDLDPMEDCRLTLCNSISLSYRIIDQLRASEPPITSTRASCPEVLSSPTECAPGRPHQLRNAISYFYEYAVYFNTISTSTTAVVDSSTPVAPLRRRSIVRPRTFYGRV